MLEAERHRIILDLAQERRIIGVLELAEMLRVSPITVRRDMNAMAALGQLRRVRGGAEAVTARDTVSLSNSFTTRREISFLDKRAIARVAASLIEDGDAVIINGGTTTYAMAEFLFERNASILTNSFLFASTLLASRNRVVIPGGAVYPEENIVLGFDTDSSVERFPGRTLFTGCYGISRIGLMEVDPLIVQAEMRLLKHAERIVVLADSSKLRRSASSVVAGLTRISTLITDSGATDIELQPFRHAGIDVLRAPIDQEDDNTNDGRRRSTPRDRAGRHIDLIQAVREAE